ncbi:MAG TPA: hypothetical protein DIW17_06880 [Clostridiales bacterium]|nr:hypothetical protein [Clostridiales bacterium]
MSFERTKGSMASLSNQTEISFDSMLDMLVCVSQDVFEHNGVNDARDIPVGDQTLLLRKEYSLVRMLLFSYESNKNALSEFGSSLRERYIQAVRELENVLVDISSIKVDVEKEENKRNELSRKQKELNYERGHLLHVKEDCDELQRQIDILNDPELDAMAEAKEKMQNELAERKAKHQELSEQQAEIQKSIDELNACLQNLNDTISEYQNAAKALKEDEDSKLREKNGLEQGIENIKRKLNEYQRWIEEFPELNKSINDSYAEMKARYTMIFNAFNSVKSDNFIKETLFAVPGTSNALSTDNYPDLNVVNNKISNMDGLITWFETIGSRIEGLISLYERMLAAMVGQSENITATGNDKLGG